MQRIRTIINEDHIDLIIDHDQWSFPKRLMSENELAMFQNFKNENVCGGCYTLPKNGFRSEKYDWYQFSRLVARLQETRY